MPDPCTHALIQAQQSYGSFNYPRSVLISSQLVLRIFFPALMETVYQSHIYVTQTMIVEIILMRDHFAMEVSVAFFVLSHYSNY